MTLEEESSLATDMLHGRVVLQIVRHRAGEVLIEFADGVRLFVNQQADGLELSITGLDETAE